MNSVDAKPPGFHWVTSGRTVAICAAVLVFVWPLPNVIALRIILLLGLLAFLTSELVRKPSLRVFSVGTRWIAMVLTGLGIWLVVISLLVFDDPAGSIAELKGGWLRTFAAFSVGLLLPAALQTRNIETKTLTRLLFWALFSLAAIQFLVGLWLSLFTGGMPEYFGGIFDHKANITFVNAITASLLLADIATPGQSRRILGLNRIAWIACFLLVLVTTYFSGARNGILVLLFLILVGGVVHLPGYWRLPRWKLWVLVGALMAFLVAAFWVMIKTDIRWARFLATVPVAWDIDKSHSWINIKKFPPPPAADGAPVEDTAYERISWARYAMRLIAEHPFGTELSRNAFRNLVTKKFGETQAAHSHNGYLDFALSAGLPGLFLWIVFLVALTWQGYKVHLSGRNGAGLALLFLTAGFAARAFLDSILRDHILEEFMFFAGLLLAASSCDDETQLACNA